MKVLFLGDDPIRTRQARICFNKDDLCEAETPEKAIKLFEKYSPYDAVNLGHDLGGNIYCPSDEACRFVVTEYISKIFKEKVPK